MISILINWVLSALVILAAAYLLPGVHVASFTAALITSLVLGIINAIIKPVLLILTLPINLLTLGLFTFVINAVLILLAASIVPGFKVDGFVWALILGIFLAIVNTVLHTIA
jgi:putative membrane protein